MEQSDFEVDTSNSQTHFETVFHRLLSGEELDFYAEGVSSTFEVIAKNLLADVAGREYHRFDGVSGLTSRVRKARQIEFAGEMWVADDNAMWKENFRARMTDKRLTKQGIWIMLWIGEDKAEGDLSTAFDLVDEVDES